MPKRVMTCINDGQVIALCHNHHLLTGIYSLPGFDGKTCNLLASLLDFGTQSYGSLPGFDGNLGLGMCM